MSAPGHLIGNTTHVRQGAQRHSFSHAVDYVLIDPEERQGPRLFSRNRRNLLAVFDRDHGGPPRGGRGADWAWEVLSAAGLQRGADSRLMLLTQPRFLGYVFNPVSFWLRFEGDALIAVIAEVNNTFGDRHCYLCALPEFAAITPGDRIVAHKVFHVSPFQEIAGDYTFSFAFPDNRVAIRIDLTNGPETLIATLSGRIVPLTERSVLGALVRRPFGAARTIALIYWQALRLKLKGARYRTRPEPPIEEITR
ncbi:DUF1365 domain-containing protein [Tropicimonas sp. IMCC34043]|uniref:DUF1365 domain-containing protein n=1 Tax=Tropicimonas sp. IMCC34043 TaxID=2248760 RepID=UPI000E27FC3C|nr:DUF1365 domain-containing protein [Tropicimonas sp. IMCC34043]